MQIVIATNNRSKLLEFRALVPVYIRLLAATDVGVELPPESGESYTENALIKARAVAGSGIPALADDSGLEVDALGGAPGIRSARFAGPGSTDEENNQLLLRRLAGTQAGDRSARFRSVVALVIPGRVDIVVEGSIEGRIATAPRGMFGFGYDPLFEIADPGAPLECGLTAAEIEPTRKNLISHRARAVQSLFDELHRRGVSIAELLTR